MCNAVAQRKAKSIKLRASGATLSRLIFVATPHKNSEATLLALCSRF